MVYVLDARKKQRFAGELAGEGSLLAAQIGLFGAAAIAILSNVPFVVRPSLGYIPAKRQCSIGKLRKEAFKPGLLVE